MCMCLMLDDIHFAEMNLCLEIHLRFQLVTWFTNKLLQFENISKLRQYYILLEIGIWKPMMGC